MLHNSSPFWIVCIIVSIVNLRKLIRSSLSIKSKVVLFIFGAICYGTFFASAHHSEMIGMHDVLFEGYIQNGAYFVARQAHAPVQISEWDYKLGLILGIGVYVSFSIFAIVAIYVFWSDENNS